MKLFKYDAAFFANAPQPGDPPRRVPDAPFTFAYPAQRTGLRALLSRFLSPIFGFLLHAFTGALFRILRRVKPVLTIGRLVIVTRDVGVRHVLGDMATFGVPYAPEMIELAGGANAVLGTDDGVQQPGPTHADLNAAIAAAMQQMGMGAAQAEAANVARALLDNSGGRIDVMSDLITRTLTETAMTYFGFTPADPGEFARWTLAVSQLLFGDPFGDAKKREQALVAAERVRAVLDDGIMQARENLKRKRRVAPANLIEHLVIKQRSWPALTDAAIRANVMGLIVGLIPTNTLAAANMLEELLRRPGELARARACAIAGDTAGLQAILVEAGRLNPALAPAIWRFTRAEGRIPAGRGGRRVKANRVVLLAIPSALRDRRRFAHPHRFNIERAEFPDLMFGHGPHSCLGAQLALAQITAIFEQLLRRSGVARALGRAGRFERAGPFPVRLDMTFEADRSIQSMIVIAGRVIDGTMLDPLQDEIARLRNPAVGPIREALDETNIVHFASISAVESAGEASAPILLLELSADGPQDVVLARVAEAAHAQLGPLFAHIDLRAGIDALNLAKVWAKHVLHLHRWPAGATGLHFVGMGEFSVQDIGRQERLAMAAREQLKVVMGGGARAAAALASVRKALRRAGGLARYDMLVPGRKRLKLAGWREPRKITDPIGGVLADPSNRLARLALLVFVGLVGASVIAFLEPFRALVYGAGTTWRDAWFWWFWAWWTPIILAGTVLATLFIAGGAAALLAFALSRHERSDRSDDGQASLAQMRPIAQREDKVSYAQNHILAVSAMKPGLLRRFTFALALWGIRQSLFWFRPGFVTKMGTIHYARWFRVPGTDRFIFLSNYDGSWESYLEDFITRANEGQSAAWSHAGGFPVTRWLIRYGAQDGDRFKRWVRRQQQPTLFWYSRFPHLTASQIRRNALIQHGLAHGATSTEARAWLGQFGSEQRQEGEIEFDEVQSLLFNGQPKSAFSTCIALRLPPNRRRASLWLRSLIGAKPTPAPGVPLPIRISFGDHHVREGASFLAFSAAGLAHMRFPPGSNGRDGAANLPPVFRFGMARRSRVLGDLNGSSPQHWAWSDRGEGQDAHAVLFVYGPAGEDEAARAAHDQAAQQHVDFLQSLGGAVVNKLKTGPARNRPITPKSLTHEHFGFRDGISQPAIRGTRQSSSRPPERDVLAPGEFILGYRNNQDYFPPPIVVRAASDPSEELPTVSASMPDRFPYFGRPDTGDAAKNTSLRDVAQLRLSEYRDFSRNGSYLVVRQLAQDVEGFQSFVRRKASEINRDYPELRNVIGRSVTANWLAAKMMGRWKNGAPLVGNPQRHAAPARGGLPDNDFSYGRDDPRGLSCPLGSHIRRTNPRDSLEPGDPEEQMITNRHRMMRRGRSYTIVDGDDQVMERGLLFVCLCADLERQFEFVQQSWVQSPSFHGLFNEPDPITSGSTGNGAAAQAGANIDPWKRVFTVPTPAGPVSVTGMESYVTTRAGGYFFMPSRSALHYLARRAARRP